MHVAFTLEAYQALPIIIRHARRPAACNFAGPHTPPQSFSLLFLQFLQYLFDRNRVEDVFGSSG